MGNKLQDMTLEELWELFPIELVEHRDEWTEQYSDMSERLEKLLKSIKGVRISHIGSTAVEGILAKPIVDVLVEIKPDENMAAVATILERSGFIIMRTDERRISLNYGYTEKGYAEKVYHIHLRYADDNDELYFRDYLNGHPAVAKEYEGLKLDLWHKFEHDRDAYTKAKADFINTVTAKAKMLYGDVYSNLK